MTRQGVKKALSKACLSDLGQSHLYPPQLALVAQAVLSDELELGIKTLLLERTAWLLEGLSICKSHVASEGTFCSATCFQKLFPQATKVKLIAGDSEASTSCAEQLRKILLSKAWNSVKECICKGSNLLGSAKESLQLR